MADAAENIAPSSKLQEFNVNKTQPAAKRAIGNVASDVTSQVIGDQTLAQSAKDLGARADQIRAQSKPVFEKLDALTKNEDMTFSDWQKQERGSYRNGDIEAANKAKVAQQNILNKYADQFDPTDLQNARKNWGQSSALDEVHDALNTKSVVGPTPVKLRPQNDPGYVNGKNFSSTIQALKRSGTLSAAGLSPEHIQSLEDLGTLLEKSANVHKFGQLAKLTEAGGVGLTAVLHPAAAVTCAKVALPAYLAQRALGRIMTNPETASTFVNILKSGAVPAVVSQGYQRGSAALGGDSDNSDFQYDPQSKTLQSQTTK